MTEPKPTPKTKPVQARGWVCPECNTFWRDELMYEVLKLEECPFSFCDGTRKEGREIVLNLGEEILIEKK